VTEKIEADAKKTATKTKKVAMCLMMCGLLRMKCLLCAGIARGDDSREAEPRREQSWVVYWVWGGFGSLARARVRGSLSDVFIYPLQTIGPRNTNIFEVLFIY
jgi:hypothetical protein